MKLPPLRMEIDTENSCNVQDAMILVYLAVYNYLINILRIT